MHHILFIGDTELGYLGIRECLKQLTDRIDLVSALPESATERVKEQEPDVVLIWLMESSDAAVRLARDLIAQSNYLPAAVLVFDPDDQLLVDAVDAKLRACIDIKASEQDICRKVELLLQGSMLFTPEQITSSRLPRLLTGREVQVLRLVGQGNNIVETAKVLGTSPGTVRNQLAEARAKLEVDTTADAVRRAWRRGVL